MRVTAKRLAEELNVTRQRLPQLVAEGMPKPVDGKYSLEDCFRFMVRFLQEALQHRPVPQPHDRDRTLASARLRVLEADAATRELELATMQRQLVPLVAVEKSWADLVVSTKARILAVPARVAPELVGETSRNMVAAKIEKALKEALVQIATSNGLPPAPG